MFIHGFTLGGAAWMVLTRPKLLPLGDSPQAAQVVGLIIIAAGAPQTIRMIWRLLGFSPALQADAQWHPFP